jgi:hypothetical protein
MAVRFWVGPKILVVKLAHFSYQCPQMHHLGAGVNRFYPDNAMDKTGTT